MDKKPGIVTCVKGIHSIQYGLPSDAAAAGEKPVINPADRQALEIAVALKEHYDVEITALCLGPAEHIGVLEYCLAAGADKGILLEHEADLWLDSRSTAHLIAPCIPAHCSLILCGERSFDRSAGLVGAFLATKLNYPQVTRVTTLEIDPVGKILEAERLLELGAREVVQCSLPCVCTVAGLANQPRFVSTHRLIKAAGAGSMIQTIKLDTSPVSNLLQIEKLDPPRPRPRKVRKPEASLTAAERLRFMMSGGQGKKTSGLLEGTSADLAGKILSFLEEQGFV